MYVINFRLIEQFFIEIDKYICILERCKKESKRTKNTNR